MGILLNHLIHLRNGLVHLADTAALLFGRSSNTVHNVTDPLNRCHQVLHRLPSLIDSLSAGIYVRERGFNQRANFVCSRGAATGEATHFLRHDGKSSAVFASTVSFNGGVQCQDIGLKGNIVDNRYDVRHLM